MKKDKGLLLILSGPSGAGKSTVISRLVQLRDDIRFSVSATTRAPRPGEVEGEAYYFMTREDFQRRISEGAFLEHAEYVGNCYGTPAAPVERNLEDGYNVLLDIEVQGAAQIMENRPETVSVFLCPPSLQELERRLRSRATDDEDKIQGRLEAASREYAQLGRYTYIVINDDADRAARELDAILTAEHCRTNNRIHNVIKGEN